MTAGLNVGSNDSLQLVCLGRAERAVQIYERARMGGRLVVFTTFAVSVSTLAFPGVFAPLMDTVIRSPVACGIWLLASFFTFAFERSTRLQRDNCLEQCEADWGTFEQAYGYFRRSTYS